MGNKTNTAVKDDTQLLVILRPTPVDEQSPFSENWIWLSSLRTVDDSHPDYTVYERDAELTFTPQERYLGAGHNLADGQPFTRLYVVPTNENPCSEFKYMNQHMSQSLGRWCPQASTRFSYRDVRHNSEFYLG